MSRDFTVLLSVYAQESPNNLDQALSSIYKEQELKPSEIVLVQDGPLTPELEEVIARYKAALPSVLKVFPLPENRGLGRSLNFGLKQCSYELVARMDTDDIALPHRFKTQIDFMEENPSVDIVGGAIEEFEQVPGDMKSIRFSREDHESLVRYAKSRNPLNHPTTLYKKSKLMEVGSYKHMPGHEDYYLWVRMIQAGAILANVKDTLLYFRVGNGMVNRRSGFKYIQHEHRFLKALKKLGFINIAEFYTLLFLKAPIRLMPNSALTILYKILRRKAA